MPADGWSGVARNVRKETWSSITGIICRGTKIFPRRDKRGLFECVIKCFASSKSERRMRDDGRCGWNATSIAGLVQPRGRDPDFFRWPGKVNELCYCRSRIRGCFPGIWG